MPALFGLVVGSFLNVCIFRLPRGTSVVWPPSACGSCRRELRWFENIPVVSWVVLRRQVRALQGADLGAVSDGRSGHRPCSSWPPSALTPIGPLLAARLLFGCALIVLFAIDLEHQILPNVITLPGIVVGLAFALVGPPGWRASLVGAAARRRRALRHRRGLLLPCARKTASAWAT